jgi:hypothetical protein
LRTQNVDTQALAFEAAYRSAESVLKSDNLMRLDRPSLRRFLEDDRCGPCELEVFRAVVRWGLNQMALLQEEEGRVDLDPDGRDTHDLEDAYEFLKPIDEIQSSAKSDVGAKSKRKGREFVGKFPEGCPLNISGAALEAMQPSRARVLAYAQNTLTSVEKQTANPKLLLGVVGDLLMCVRFPQIDGVGLASDVGPSGLLSDEQLSALYLHQFRPLKEREAVSEVAGFNNAPRKPISKEVTIILWGGGGGSGQHASSGVGGAGGYLRVRYQVFPGEELTITVGQGGQFASDSAYKPGAYPNGGR